MSSTATTAKRIGGILHSWLKATVPKRHRVFGENESKHLRIATRKTGDNAVVKENPGARVEPSFLTIEEGNDVVYSGMDIIKKYGICHVTDEQRAFCASQMKHLPLPKDQLASLVNMQRVTGRFESDEQKLAPWGHGDDFNLQQVPDPLKKVIKKIQSCERFALGAPRDITLNYRHSYFYRLDPHIDPMKDGGNVFILGLLSGTVLSLSPHHPAMHPNQFLHMDQRKVAERSWQPGKDIDVDLPERTLLHLSGKARSEWNHGIRLGVSKYQLNDFGTTLVEDEDESRGKPEGIVRLYDWWGNMNEPRIRQPERLSIIFAFADPEW